MPSQIPAERPGVRGRLGVGAGGLSGSAKASCTNSATVAGGAFRGAQPTGRPVRDREAAKDWGWDIGLSVGLEEETQEWDPSSSLRVGLET